MTRDDRVGRTDLGSRGGRFLLQPQVKPGKKLTVTRNASPHLSAPSLASPGMPPNFAGKIREIAETPDAALAMLREFLLQSGTDAAEPPGAGVIQW